MASTAQCIRLRLATVLPMVGAVSAALLSLSASPASAAVASCGANCTKFVATAGVASGRADAAAALSRTLSEVPRGWTVQLPPGTFRVSRPIRVPAGVTLAGSGMDNTVLLLDRRSWASFAYGFMVTGVGSKRTQAATTVRDLTINGNRVPVDSVGAGAKPRSNQGGGIRLSDGWTVTRVRFANLNYFRVWAKSVSNVTVSDSRFEETGNGVASGNDNIGGGSVTRGVFRGNFFAATARGNAIDLVTSRRIVFDGNRIEGTAKAPHNVYLEGVTDSAVTGNVLRHSSITIQSNSGYSATRRVINPSRVTVADNIVTDPSAQGIALRYDPARGGTAAAGGNRILRNEVVRSRVAGIIVMAAANGLVSTADQVVANRVDDAFAGGAAEWNCGYGVAGAAGIVIGVASGSDVSGNFISAGQMQRTTRIGVQFGLRSGRGVTVNYRTASPNRVAGIDLAEYAVRSGN